jgi:hypothetical protein
MANFSDGGIGKNWVPEPVTYDFYLLGWTRVNDWLDLLYKFQVTFNAENIKNIKSNLKEAKRIGEWIRGSRYGGGSRYLPTYEFNRMVK